MYTYTISHQTICLHTQSEKILFCFNNNTEKGGRNLKEGRHIIIFLQCTHTKVHSRSPTENPLLVVVGGQKGKKVEMLMLLRFPGAACPVFI